MLMTMLLTISAAALIGRTVYYFAKRKNCKVRQDNICNKGKGERVVTKAG